MAESSKDKMGSVAAQDKSTRRRPEKSRYDHWMEEQGVPIHRGYYVEDVRTVELGWWAARECHAAFLQLAGQEGVSEARITEIPPGESLPPLKLSIDEVVYAVEGQGLTTVWEGTGEYKRTFEWQAHSMFLLPAGTTHRLSNAQGYRSARLLHYNYLPVAMSVISEPDFFFNNQSIEFYPLSTQGEFYSEAKIRGQADATSHWEGLHWSGNFFPDMRAWDRLLPLRQRGAGGNAVFIRFPGSELRVHMSVFQARTYKKAHRHGPGRVIIIPAGEGYSVLWEEGSEKIVVPWHEGSVFVPPNRWFHQHFNVGAAPARYLALHPLPQFSGHAEKVQDRVRDLVEYPDEEPWIREKFEEQLAQRGLTSLMPEEAYQNQAYEWAYGEGSSK
jgi:oxalate decarboxylase/phosphoglucose isomerase-like protein (cupin superfamily)